MLVPLRDSVSFEVSIGAVLVVQYRNEWRE